MPRPLWTDLLLLTLPCCATTPSTPDLLNRLNTASQLSTLSDPALKPWHLKVDFDLLDPKGAVREHGTLEEWWAAPDRFRVSIVSPGYTATETRDGEKGFRTVGQPRRPDLEEVLVSQINEPLLAKFDAEKLSAIFEKKAFGKIDLDCIMPVALNQVKARLYLGQETTYCFDPGQTDLRILIRYREQFILRNRVGRFQDRNVALDINVIDAGKLLLKSQTTQLTTYTPGEHDFEATADQQAIPITPRTSSAVMAGMLLTKFAPDYPKLARDNHISGVVVLHATIGKDGLIKDLSPIRSPDKLLTDAAMVAVRQWTYKPYLLNGEPTEVETTITVNFNMG